MPTVKIDTPGVSVELVASEASIGELGKQALELYRDACAVDVPKLTIGFGSQSLDKRWTADHHDDNGFAVVKAEGR